MTLEKQLSDSVFEQIYDIVRDRTTAGGRVLKNNTPDHRDMRSQTFAFISDDSDENRAVIVMVSDPKNPDVLTIKGQPYRGGVDLANVANGLRAGGTKRKKPLATHGWWDKAVKAAVQTIAGS